MLPYFGLSALYLPTTDLTFLHQLHRIVMIDKNYSTLLFSGLKYVKFLDGCPDCGLWNNKRKYTVVLLLYYQFVTSSKLRISYGQLLAMNPRYLMYELPI